MIALAPCPTEDSVDCFWDATVQGNGVGQSFFVFDGITVLVEVPDGFFIESVQVDEDHFFEPGYAGGAGYGVTFAEPDAPPVGVTPVPVPTVTATAAPTSSSVPLPATGLDMTAPVLMLGVAVLVSIVGVVLSAWKGRAS